MKKLGRMVALILTFSLLLASSAFAATKASSQILKHSIDITANKGGEIAIEVSVTGNGLMKQIGVEKIKIYENGTTLVESLIKMILECLRKTLLLMRIQFISMAKPAHGIGSKLAFLRKMQAEIPTPVLKPSL